MGGRNEGVWCMKRLKGPAEEAGIRERGGYKERERGKGKMMEVREQEG